MQFFNSFLPLSISATWYSFLIFPLFSSSFPLLFSSVLPSFLSSVPGLSWLLVPLYLPDAQKCYQRALCTPCPPRHWGELSISPTTHGYDPSHPLLCLPDQGHQGGAVASLPETGSCVQLSQLKLQPVALTSHATDPACLLRLIWQCFPWKSLRVYSREIVLLNWNKAVANWGFYLKWPPLRRT